MTIHTRSMAARVEQNPMLVTALTPAIGYDRAARIAKQAYAEGRSLKEVAADMTDLGADELNRLLDPRSMVGGLGLKA
jgi:fumarate hydratase class II